jgi:hypothetical protein
MNGLPLRCAATIGWVILLAELDLRWDVFQLGASGYLLLAASAAILVVPTLRRVNTPWVLAVAFPVFCALELLSGPVDLQSAGTSLLEFTGVAVAMVLTSRLARGLALADEVIRELALGTARETAVAFARIQGEMFRELRRARRYERPLSLLAVAAHGSQPSAALVQLLEEARRESLERLVGLRVGGLLDEQTSGSAVIAERDGHFLVLLPEAERQEAERLAKRLEQTASDRHGIRLSFGIASFPHQEITFDKLLESAESALRATLREASDADASPEAAAQLVPSAPVRG